MKKFLKIFFIVIISLVIIVYGGVFLGHRVFFKEITSDVPTIIGITDGRLTLGIQAHPPHPVTVEEFLLILAEQLRRYNEIAPSLWPNNGVVDQALMVENISNNRFWLISVDGAISSLTLNQALAYGINRAPYVDGFSSFDGGMYYAISDSDLKNVLGWEKYLHLGTYDAILFLTHEQFHYLEQGKWPYMENIPNRGRNEFLEDIQARTKRYLLQKQLLNAVSTPDNTQLILDALATYKDWKNQFPDDYNNSIYFDRIEGTAFYYELVSGLFIGYPDQIKNSSDLDRALALLATRHDIYTWHGLVAEGYGVGGFSCVLLDRLEIDWKEYLMNTPDATPIEMLYKHFSEEPLPEPIQITQTDIDTVMMRIQIRTDVKPRVFRFLYDILF